jgi:hypothetical protein
MYPEARSVGAWVRHGWFVPVAYVVGFFVMLAIWGWHPSANRSGTAQAQPASCSTACVASLAASAAYEAPWARVSLTPAKRA